MSFYSRCGKGTEYLPTCDALEKHLKRSILQTTSGERCYYSQSTIIDGYKIEDQRAPMRTTMPLDKDVFCLEIK